MLSSLWACPHGVAAMSQDVPGFVETSTNLASVQTDFETNTIKVVTSQRSSTKSESRAIASKVRAALELGGACVEHMNEYPQQMRIVLRETFRRETVGARHSRGIGVRIIPREIPGTRYDFIWTYPQGRSRTGRETGIGEFGQICPSSRRRGRKFRMI